MPPFDWVKDAVHVEPQAASAMAIKLLVAFLMGLVVAGVYGLTIRRRNGTMRAFLTTLVLLSVVICLVTLVIGDNMARAFSLVGALAIVRFRTVVEDTRDTAFVMFAVVIGMAAGAGIVLPALMATPIVLLTAWMFRPRTTVVVEDKSGRLVLRLAAISPPDEAVRATLEKHLGGARLTGLSTARGGAALDVTYAVTLPGAEQAVALLAELSRIEGVQSVELKE